MCVYRVFIYFLSREGISKKVPYMWYTNDIVGDRRGQRKCTDGGEKEGPVLSIQ